MGDQPDGPKVWINGTLIPSKEATVPLMSHGLSRGSAVFEVFGVHVGPDGPAAFRMDEHLKRLAGSLAMLEMTLAYSQDEIEAGVSEVVRANGMGRGLIKVIAYWGEEAIIQLVLDAPLDLAVFAIPDDEALGLDRVKPIPRASPGGASSTTKRSPCRPRPAPTTSMATWPAGTRVTGASTWD